MLKRCGHVRGKREGRSIFFKLKYPYLLEMAAVAGCKGGSYLQAPSSAPADVTSSSASALLNSTRDGDTVEKNAFFAKYVTSQKVNF